MAKLLALIFISIFSTKSLGRRVVVHQQVGGFSDDIVLQRLKVTCNNESEVFTRANQKTVAVFHYNGTILNLGSTALYLMTCETVNTTNGLQTKSNLQTSNVTKSQSKIIEINIHKSCNEKFQVEGKCIRKTSRGSDGDIRSSPSTTPTTTLAVFVVGGCMLVGFLVFAIVRIRKIDHKPTSSRRTSRNLQGVDNQGISENDSRAQQLVNTINANGSHYSVVEMENTTPGRRVFIISTDQQLPRHGLSRIRSQLSDISEENETSSIENMRTTDSNLSQTNGNCGQHERVTSLASSNSSNGGKCSNNVVNEEYARTLSEENFKYDVRISSGHSSDTTSYLQEFGWTPRNKISQSDSHSSTSSSCGEIFSSIHLSFSSEDDSDSSSFQKEYSFDGKIKLSESSATLSHLDSAGKKKSESTFSLPAVLDVSKIPDINEVLSSQSTNLLSDSFSNDSM